MIERIKKEPLEFESLFDSLSNRANIESLYRELCLVLHPDRIITDLEKKKIAESLFKELQANRFNYDGLLRIKESIKDLL